MNIKVLIKGIKKDKTLANYIKSDLIAILKSDLYKDTLTIVSTLDKSPRSMACIFRFKQLDPTKVRIKQQIVDFKSELTSIKNECLRCTINPYFFIPTKTNSYVRTIGDIIIPNSKNVLTINDIVTNPRYNYLDKPKMIKDYLLTWNRDAKKFLDDKVQNDREYLAKSHGIKYTSNALKFGSFLSGLAAIYALLRISSLDLSNFKNVVLILVAVLSFALVTITSSVVNSFHSRNLRKYDKQMKELDKLYERYADHTFDVEADTLKHVYAHKLCSYPLSQINKIGPMVKRFTIERYVYAEKYYANRKYGILKALAFVGFVASIVCAILLFTL